MIDLPQIVAEFLEGYLLREQDEIILDHIALNALHSARIEPAVRQTEIATWLLHTRVLRLNGVTAECLAQALLTLADTRPRLSLPLTPPQILAEFEAVCEALSPHIAPPPSSSPPKNIDCLISRALWLIYPHDVPIVDRPAENALRVILRLQGRTCKTIGTRYPNFLDAWLTAFRDVKPVIHAANLGDYPYEPRVFDCFLSWLGQDWLPTTDDFFTLPQAPVRGMVHG